MIKQRLMVTSIFFSVFLSAAPVRGQEQATYRSIPLNKQGADRQTLFNDVTDFFATMGTSKKEARQIIYERRADRRDARLKAERRRKAAQSRKRIRNEQKAIMQKLNSGHTNVGL